MSPAATSAPEKKPTKTEGPSPTPGAAKPPLNPLVSNRPKGTLGPIGASSAQPVVSAPLPPSVVPPPPRSPADVMAMHAAYGNAAIAGAAAAGVLSMPKPEAPVAAAKGATAGAKPGIEAKEAKGGHAGDKPGIEKKAIPVHLISEANLSAMHEDVETIVARLKQQVLIASEEQEIVDLVQTWADWDESYARSGGTGTPFLDKFLFLLKVRTFSRSTARTMFGLAGDEWLNAYDGLFYELEDERLVEFRSLIRRSREGSGQPGAKQMQTVYGYVGKRVLLGFGGILKNMSTTVSSVADASAWANWRMSGHPGKPPQITEDVAKGYDEIANMVAEALAEGATPEELEKERREIMEEYGFGDRWGTVVGILMSAGMGGSGVSKGLQLLSKAAAIAQGAQGVENAAVKLSKRIDAIRKSQPNATWTDLIADDEVRLTINEGIVALIGVVGGLAGVGGDKTAVAKFFSRFGLVLGFANLIPQMQQAWIHYSDPNLKADEREKVLEKDIATIVGTVMATIGGHADEKLGQQKATAVAAASTKSPPPALTGEPSGQPRGPEPLFAYEPHPFEGTPTGLEPMSPAPQPLELVGPSAAPAEPATAGSTADQPVRLYDPNGRQVDVRGVSIVEPAASRSPKFFDAAGRPGELSGGQFVPEGMISPNEYIGPTTLYDAAGNPVEVAGGYTGGKSVAPAPRRGNEPSSPLARTADVVPVDPDIAAMVRGNVMDDKVIDPDIGEAGAEAHGEALKAARVSLIKRVQARLGGKALSYSEAEIDNFLKEGRDLGLSEKSIEDTLYRAEVAGKALKPAEVADRLKMRAEGEKKAAGARAVAEELKAAAELKAAWDRFESAHDAEFKSKLKEFRGNDDLTMDRKLAGGEGQLFPSDKTPGMALKRWFKLRSGEFASAVARLSKAKAVVDSIPALKNVLEVVRVHAQGTDWILRDFDRSSRPMGDFTADPVATAARQQAIYALRDATDPMAVEIRGKLEGNSSNIHWSADQKKLLVIDTQ